jgi:hypothetical protein
MLTWGFVPVWFSASPDVARRAFIQRGGIDVKYFDQFWDLLAASESEVMTVFGHHVIYPLREDGTRMNPVEIYAQLVEWL